MRDALGLMLASVVAAVLIAGVWYWNSAPRADAAPPQTIAAKASEPLPLASARAAAKDDVDVTGALASQPATPVAPPALIAQQPACANPAPRTVIALTSNGTSVR